MYQPRYDLKPYHKLQCDLLDEIKLEALSFLRSKYDLSDHTSLKTDLWLKINTREMIPQVPSLLRWTRSLGLRLREISATIVNDTQGAGLHIDELPVTAKINVPILNTDWSANSWYHVPEHLIGQPKINQFGKEFYPLNRIDLSACSLLGETKLDSPIVFNSQIPHLVSVEPESLFPRVVLCCMFFDEPIDYLKI